MRSLKRWSTLLCVILLLLFVGTGTSLPAQQFDRFRFSFMPGARVPIGTDAEIYDVGGGAAIHAAYDITSFLFGGVQIDYSVIPTPAQSSLTVVSAGLETGLVLAAGGRSGFTLSAGGGYYSARFDQLTTSNPYYQAALSYDFLLRPGIQLAAGGSYTSLLAADGPLFTGVGAFLGATIQIGDLSGEAKVDVQSVEFEPVFPIFYAYYDENSFGTVNVRNAEAGTIQNVTVSFFVPQYMDQPRVFARIATMSRDETAELPIYALFTDGILEITEDSKVNAQIQVEYDYLNTRLSREVATTLRVHHRNAMTWDDDRKAAAFVSPRDPGMLRLSKYAAGIVREHGSTELNEKLRVAMGMFEALRTYGVNYVVDPSTPYAELSQSDLAVDYLQFPSQTLVYRAGDCDDLSILYSAMLESVGIRTAFLTVPGHLFMAFDLDMTEAEARALFSNTDELIFDRQRAWLPVETTIINEGFMKAWQVAAKEWRDNKETDNAKIFDIEDSWNFYGPVSIPGSDERVQLPQADQIIAGYTDALAKFVTREIQGKVEELKAELARRGESPRLLNRLGVLYARYGLLDDAEREFKKAGKSAYGPALVNLGNISYLRKDYQQALSYYHRAEQQNPESAAVLLGIARAQYELENYDSVEVAFSKIEKLSPDTAEKFSYLVSRSSGVARASSAARQLPSQWVSEE